MLDRTVDLFRDVLPGSLLLLKQWVRRNILNREDASYNDPYDAHLQHEIGVLISIIFHTTPFFV